MNDQRAKSVMRMGGEGEELGTQKVALQGKSYQDPRYLSRHQPKRGDQKYGSRESEGYGCVRA